MKAKVCLLDSHREAEGVEEEDIELFYDDLEEDFEEGLVRNFLEEEEEEI